MITLTADDGTTYPVREQPGRFVHSLVACDLDGSQAAHITWNEYTGQIWGVEVRADLRRQGMATMLYLLAREIEPRLHHSATRSDDGEAWARSLGEPLPERLAA